MAVHGPMAITAAIIKMVFGELNEAGIRTELIQLHDKTIEPCRGCFTCKEKNNCTFADDDFCSIFEKMCAADGILLGSPAYSADVSAKMKTLLERAGVVAAVNPGLFRHKVGLAVAAVRRGGGMTAVDTINHVFLNKEMLIAGSTYWNMVYGMAPGEVFPDEEGVRNMHNLGQNMAWLLQTIKKTQ